MDQAETEPDLAHAVNALAPRLAEALVDAGGRLLQLSTDFVFNGQQGGPYRPEQARNPLGMYGISKAKGEEAVEQVLGNSDQGLILRTSWVMGPVGRNFALTMLRFIRSATPSAWWLIRWAARQPPTAWRQPAGRRSGAAVLATACPQ